MILLVLGDVSQCFSTSGSSTRRQQVLTAPRRSYVAFGEHLSAGVCVRVCISKVVVLCVCVCVCSFVCVLGRLFADSCKICLLGWLLVCVHVCLRVVQIAVHFRCLLTRVELALCLSCTFGNPRSSLWAPVATVVAKLICFDTLRDLGLCLVKATGMDHGRILRFVRTNAKNKNEQRRSDASVFVGIAN